MARGYRLPIDGFVIEASTRGFRVPGGAFAIETIPSGAVTGTGSLTTTVTTASGTGTLTHTGAGALTTGVTTASGTGTLAHKGTGDLTTGVTTLSGTGTVSPGGAVTGTGDLTTGVTALSGTGTITHTGTGALTVNAVEVSGTGTLSHTGTGDLTTGDVTVSGYDSTPVTTTTPTGGIGHGGKRKRTIVVDVDGKEYRVSEEQLPAFLELVKEKAEVEPPKVEKRKTRRKIVETPVAPVVTVKVAEPEVRFKIQAQVDRTNEILQAIIAASYQRYLEDNEDDEMLLMML